MPTYLVARRGLTPRGLAAARRLVESPSVPGGMLGVEPTLGDAGEVLQGVEAFLGILIYIGENSSPIHSNLLEIIHHRCSGLKLNIQTKILHAAIRLPDPETAPAAVPAAMPAVADE